MSQKIKCSNCGADATVHLTQIVNNKIIKVDLCEACAQEKGVTDPQGFSLAELLNKSNVPVPQEEVDLACPDCGMQAADFRRTGRLGCSSCFESFAPLLRPVLEDMHVGGEHKGKIPRRALERRSFTQDLKRLEAALAVAIEKEAYEDAANYRDQIRDLQESQANSEAVSS